MRNQGRDCRVHARDITLPLYHPSDSTKDRYIHPDDFDLAAPKSKINGIPSVEELRDALRAWLMVEKPEFLLTDLQDWCLHNNMVLIFTFPYGPATQPIELVWSALKHNVGDLFHWNRDAVGLMSDVRKVWVTKSGLLQEGAGDNPQALKYIGKAIKWSNKEILPKLSDYYVSGTLGSLELSDAGKKLVDRWTTDDGLTLYLDSIDIEAFLDGEAAAAEPAPAPVVAVVPLVAAGGAGAAAPVVAVVRQSARLSEKAKRAAVPVHGDE
jgi:hypothetical protein